MDYTHDYALGETTFRIITFLDKSMKKNTNKCKEKNSTFSYPMVTHSNKCHNHAWGEIGSRRFNSSLHQTFDKNQTWS